MNHLLVCNIWTGSSVRFACYRAWLAENDIICHVVLNRKTSVHLQNTNEDIVNETWAISVPRLNVHVTKTDASKSSHLYHWKNSHINQAGLHFIHSFNLGFYHISTQQHIEMHIKNGQRKLKCTCLICRNQWGLFFMSRKLFQGLFLHLSKHGWASICHIWCAPCAFIRDYMWINILINWIFN